MSARGAVAQQQGVDDEMLAKIDDYERSDLSPEQQAALRLADAYLSAPATMTGATRDDIARHLTPLQIVETVLKVGGYSSDKVMVALGLDLDEVRPFTL